MKTTLVLNWKMNPATRAEAVKLAQALVKINRPKDMGLVIAPPAFFLEAIAKGKGKTVLAGQNISGFKEGAYTGELSAKQLKSVGAGAVIINHSETKNGSEYLETAAGKVALALSVGLQPIICLGETERDKEGKYLAALENELGVLLSKIKKSQAGKIILAYEPIWAVGANEADTPEDFHHNALFLRKVVSDRFGDTIAKQITILYGGSVNRKNAADFIKAGAQGLLIGRASLSGGEMRQIVDSIAKLSAK